MVKFVARYLKALGFLTAAMVLYAFVVVPFVEPTDGAAQDLPVFSRNLPSEHWWQKHFQEGAWQTQDPKIIHSNRGILVSRSWVPIDDKTWKLEPLTMIVPQSPARQAADDSQVGHDLNHDLWIISAEEGAEIHFEEPPDITSGSVPTVVRGDLRGQIEVTRKTNQIQSGRPWRLRTRDLTIRRSQVTTRSEVFIEWDDSVIQGRDLRLQLRGDLLGSQGNESSEWGPLDELELYHLDQLDVGLPKGGIWAKLDPQQFDGQSVGQLPARLRAKCGGRFVFDFKSSLATLQNGVKVEHQLGSMPPDQFLCEQISFSVEPPARSNSPLGGPKPAELPGLAGIQLNGLEAIGADSIQDFVGEKWVELRVPTVDLYSRSKSLKVDLQKQRIAFAGRLERPGSTQSSVVLNYQGNEFRSPQIEYQAAPNSDAPADQHLGWLVAEGPGELKTRAHSLPDSQSSTVDGSRQSIGNSLAGTHVRWQKSLNMKPTAETDGAQWVELLGNTLIEHPKHGFLASERVEIWLSPSKSKTLASTLPRDGTNPDSNAPPNIDSPSLVPNRVLSTGNTILSTEWVKAQVASLDLNLNFVSDEPPSGESDPNNLNLSDSAGNPMYQWVSPPAEANAVGPSSQPATDAQVSAAPPNPIAVAGQSLRANIISSGDDFWIEQLQIDGPVRVQGDPARADARLPWHVEGDVMLLATNREGQADLQIEGRPAKVVLADGSLEGQTIRFNQTHRILLMDHPGEFTIPQSVLARSNANQDPKTLAEGTTPASVMAGSEVQWYEPPHCRWQGRMIFDGSVVRIEGNVEFDAAMRISSDQFWRVAGVSQQMEIHLANALALDSKAPQAVEIERMVLKDQVDIRAAQWNSTGEKQSKEEIHVPMLTFLVGQSQLVATGPGWLQSNYLSEREIGQLASASELASDATLQGAYLAFRDSMVGLLSRNELTFEGKVELLAGPVAGWEDSVRQRALDQLAQDQMLLNCDQLKVYDTSQLSTVGTTANASMDTWEFRAKGNVAFNGVTESGEYLGNGYQLTFVQAKNQLTLRGDGRSPAYVERVPAGAEENTYKAYVESITINPKTSQLHLELGASGFQMQRGGQTPGVSSGRGLDLFPLPQGGANPWTPQSALPGAEPPPYIPDPRQDFYKRDPR